MKINQFQEVLSFRKKDTKNRVHKSLLSKSTMRLVSIGMLCLLSHTVFGQRDVTSYNNLPQPDARIHVSLRHDRTIGFADVQYFGVVIRNNTNDKLKVELEYTAHLTCGQVATGRIGFGNGLVIMPNQTTTPEGWFDKDNTVFDVGNRRNSECIKSSRPKVPAGNDGFTAIDRVSFRLISIVNLTEKEKQEADRLLAEKLVREGETKSYAKDYDGAIAKYQEALKIDPTNEKAEKRIEEAEKKKAELLEKEAAKLQKAKAAEAIKRGDEKLAQGDLSGAENEYNEAEKLDPENSSIKAKKEQIDAKKEEKATNDLKLKEEEEKKTAKVAEEKKEKEEKAAQEKRDAEMEAAEEKRKAEEEAERRRIEEERQRIQRKNQYYENKQKEYQANTDLAAESSAEIILLLIKLGVIMYQDLDRDLPMSSFFDDNWRLSLKMGYSFTSVPMIFNSSIEDFDGNYYSYTHESLDKQSATLELNGGVELWPMYGKNLGFGLHGQGGIGIGVGLQQYTGFAQGGAKAYVGFERMKFYGEYSVGFRSVSLNPWIDPQQMGGGKLSYNYHRIFTGLRHTIPGKMDTKGINITVGPLFENQDYKRNNYFNPIVVRWNSGVKLEIDVENRLCLFAEVFPNYARGGEVDESYNPIFKSTGTYFRIGVFRNVDFFGDSPYAHSNDLIERRRKKKAYTGISFINPSFNWVVDKKQVVTTKMLQFGINLGFEQDIKLFSDVNFMTGAIISINNGGNSFNGVEEAKYKSHSLQIPLGIRIYLDNAAKLNRKWISSAFKNDISVINDNYGFKKSAIKRYTGALSFGGGIDYMLGAKTYARVGINYDYGVQSVFSSPTMDVRKRAVYLQAGFIF